MNKRGALNKWILWTIILIVVVAVVWIFFFDNPREEKLGFREKIVKNVPTQWGKNFTSNLLLEGKSGAFFGGVIDETRGLLGFDKGVVDFVLDLLKGGLVGFWIWITYFMAKAETGLSFIFRRGSIKGEMELKKLESTWLAFIGSSPWKIVPLATLYAVVMQVPFLNSFIKIISLEFLFYFQNVVWGAILESIVLAFLIGFLPAIIESYTKYKLEKKYYNALQYQKFEKAYLKELTSPR